MRLVRIRGESMSLTTRIVFFGLIGILAGILTWPFAELILYYQASFPTLLLFNIALGITVGLFMGACFGTSEGIIAASKVKIRTGIATGVIAGIIGGIIGFVAGQAALLFLGTTFFHSTYGFQKIGFPVSKAVGWATFGMCAGMAHGIRRQAGSKIRNGIIGGFIGGFLGGLAVEYIKVLSPGNVYARLVGLMVLGLLIGIFYGIIENKLAKASLLLLNGKYKDREFLLTQRLTNIGRSPKTEVGLSGYNNVADVHTIIKKEKDDFVLTDAGSKNGTLINDDKTGRVKLRNGDVIRIGDAQFIFRKK
ncbi:hypothetical protein ES703_60128 [subsurface metagenome]